MRSSRSESELSGFQQDSPPAAPSSGSSANSEASSTSTSREDDNTAPETEAKNLPSPRVYCGHCSEHPEGFRDERACAIHIRHCHNNEEVRFVCRDPATVGIESKLKAIRPLSKCKACSSGKEYHAYYNAAAHLKRAHFKSASRQKKKSDNQEDRYWTSQMAEIRDWYFEKWIKVDENGCRIDEQAELDCNLEEASTT